MSNAALARIDARLHAALERVGAADRGNYRATPEATPVSVRCYLDGQLQQVGDFARLPGGFVSLRLLRADVPAPARGAQVTVGAEVFELDELVSADEGATVWEAARV